MKNLTKLVAICSVFLFAGCDSDDPNFVEVSPPPPEPLADARLQVLHASPDAPAVNVFVDGEEALTAVDYKTGSGALAVSRGTYNVRVEAIIPGGNADVVDADLQLLGGVIYTVAAIGSVADETFAPLIISQVDNPVTPGSARVFVLHGAEGAPEVDVYVTGPDTELVPGLAPLGTFAYTETLGPVEVAAGDYRIRVTGAGDPEQVVIYDSGSLPLADGDDLTIAAVTNTLVGAEATAASPAQPISLVALNGAGSLEILTADTPTQLQAVHASPDAGLVDIVVDGGVAASIDFTEATGYLQVPAGTYNIAVNPAGSAMSAIGPVDLDLAPGIRHDVVAVGNAVDMTIEPLILTDDPRRVATEAKVRIVHGASNPAAALVDIYVTAVGAGIADVDPTLPNIAYKANTGFLGLPAGVDYDVTVTVAGTKDIAIGPATLPVLDAGGIYTAIARDPNPLVPGDGFGVILLDDFLP
jgi:hypothetical protein